MTRVITQPWEDGGNPSFKPTVVILNNDHVLITSDADTDADGSPDATRIDDSGQLQTSLGKPSWKGKGDYVNAREIPYYVLPLNWQEVTGVNCKLGDIAKLTYKDKSIYAIYADKGPKNIIGEASIIAIELLGGDPWNSSHTKIISGIPHGVTYEIIPNSANLNITTSHATIQSYGKELFGEAPKPNLSDIQKSVTWLEFNRASDGTPAITAYAGSTPKYTRHYKTKELLIEFLQAFPNAHTAPVAGTNAIPDCPDLTGIILPDSSDSDAEQFVSFFKTNYAAVRKEVQEWFVDKYHYSDNATHNACVAHQVSCLELCQLPQNLRIDRISIMCI
jgi:hypothetical protein